MGPQVDVLTGPRCDGVPMEKPCRFVSARFSPNTIFLRVQVEGDGDSRKEEGIWRVLGDDAELGGAAVGVCLGVLTRLEAKEEGQDNEVCPALGEGIGCGAGHRKHD